MNEILGPDDGSEGSVEMYSVSLRTRPEPLNDAYASLSAARWSQRLALEALHRERQLWEEKQKLMEDERRMMKESLDLAARQLLEAEERANRYEVREKEGQENKHAMEETIELLTFELTTKREEGEQLSKVIQSFGRQLTELRSLCDDRRSEAASSIVSLQKEIEQLRSDQQKDRDVSSNEITALRRALQEASTKHLEQVSALEETHARERTRLQSEVERVEGKLNRTEESTTQMGKDFTTQLIDLRSAQNDNQLEFTRHTAELETRLREEQDTKAAQVEALHAEAHRLEQVELTQTLIQLKEILLSQETEIRKLSTVVTTLRTEVQVQQDWRSTLLHALKTMKFQIPFLPLGQQQLGVQELVPEADLDALVALDSPMCESNTPVTSAPKISISISTPERKDSSKLDEDFIDIDWPLSPRPGVFGES